MTARRTAGRLGCGGGLPAESGLRLFPPPADGLEAQVLQVREGDAGHQRVPVQAGPGAPLEVAQAQFLFELLVPCSHTQRALMAAARSRSGMLGGRLPR